MPTVKINGKEYEVRYTIKSIIEAEEQAKTSITELAEKRGFKFLATVAYAGIYHSAPGLTLEVFIESLGCPAALDEASPILAAEYLKATGQLKKDEDPKKDLPVSA